jgi:uncharacterized protein DUF4360
MRARTSFPSVRLVGVLLALAVSVAAGAAGAADPDPSEVYVRSISYGGSGCPQGSVGQSFSADRKTFTLIFDSFSAVTGPGVPIRESRKSCQINLNLHLPQGWSYTIVPLDYRGFVGAGPGVVAEQKSIYYFQGEVTQASAGSRFSGPIARDFGVSDTVAVNSEMWAPCGRIVPLNINAQVRLSSNTLTSAQITTDSIDGKVKFVFGFQWKHC